MLNIKNSFLVGYNYIIILLTTTQLQLKINDYKKVKANKIIELKNNSKVNKPILEDIPGSGPP